MRFSVVIPTYNRSSILADCLTALFQQDFSRDEYEIIVVNDGSKDDTEKVLAEMKEKSPVPLRSFSQENAGQGVARNRGVREAVGEIILLLGDDIIATPELLKEHDTVHRRFPDENAAVLGFVTWHPKLAVTALMRFMERGGAILGRFGGHQFAYDLLRGKATADYHFFYTANISLKRSMLLAHPFDPWFSGYGWEDIELGFRLTKRAGLVLHYAPVARAYHDHLITFDAWASRMREIGAASKRLAHRHPELHTLPSQQKRFLLKLLSNPLTLALLRPLWRDLYFYGLSKKYLLEGMQESEL